MEETAYDEFEELQDIKDTFLTNTVTSIEKQLVKNSNKLQDFTLVADKKMTGLVK